MVCSWLRDARGPVCSTTRPVVDRLLHARDDEALAELRDAAVAELDRLGEVVARVDVHQRKRKATRPEGLLREPEQDDRVLSAREEEHRALELSRDLPHDVDRLGLERVEVREADKGVGGRHGSGFRSKVGQAWSPHSVLPEPAQRPSRPVPGLVQCVQPIEA